MALSWYDEVRARVAPDGLVVEVVGEGARSLPRSERHLVVSSMRAAFDRLGGQPTGLSVRCANSLPQSRGLGSSSAAIVAGVLAARALVVNGAELLDDDAVLALATELEGHPDNVAPCLLGGFTLAWTGDDGVRAVSRALHPDVVAVVLLPTERSSTKQVRGLLPAQVPHADAAANGVRSALLSLALTDDPSLLLAATEDRLHQDYRAPAMPRTAELVASLRGAGLAAAVSGAGPSVLVLTVSDQLPVVERLSPAGWALHRLAVDQQGATVACDAP